MGFFHWHQPILYIPLRQYTARRLYRRNTDYTKRALHILLSRRCVNIRFIRHLPSRLYSITSPFNPPLLYESTDVLPLLPRKTIFNCGKANPLRPKRQYRREKTVLSGAETPKRKGERGGKPGCISPPLVHFS